MLASEQLLLPNQRSLGCIATAGPRSVTNKVFDACAFESIPWITLYLECKNESFLVLFEDGSAVALRRNLKNLVVANRCNDERIIIFQ